MALQYLLQLMFNMISTHSYQIRPNREVDSLKDDRTRIVEFSPQKDTSASQIAISSSKVRKEKESALDEGVTRIGSVRRRLRTWHVQNSLFANFIHALVNSNITEVVLIDVKIVSSM